MLKILSRDDYSLLKAFFPKEYPLDELLNPVNGSRILCAMIEKKITSLIIVNLIKNQYYMTIHKKEAKKEEISLLLQFTLKVLKQDEAGLYVLYDNCPFDKEMDEVLKENGFLYDFLNYEYTPNPNQVYSISSKILINDRSEDVTNYMKEKILGEEFSIEHANIAVARDSSGTVLGVARFALITEKIFVSMLYGEQDEVIIDLLHLIINLTNRPIEIGITPRRIKLGRLLETAGFTMSQADYILNLRG